LFLFIRVGKENILPIDRLSCLDADIFDERISFLPGDFLFGSFLSPTAAWIHLQPRKGPSRKPIFGPTGSFNGMVDRLGEGCSTERPPLKILNHQIGRLLRASRSLKC